MWILEASSQADAVELYLAACKPFFAVELREAAETFYNRTEGYHLGNALFGRCETVAQRFNRTWAHIAADATDTVQAILQLKGGWTGLYDGRVVEGGPGSVRFVDMARPFDLSTEAFETLNLVVPRALLGNQSLLHIHGMVVPGDSVDGVLIGSQMRGLWDVVDRMSIREGATALAAAIALVSGVLAGRAPSSTDDARPSARRLLAAARALIDENRGDADLTPDMLAKRLGVSRSLLYEAFAPIGGVASFIQARRLDHAFDALTAPAPPGRSLAEVAYAHGFRSAAHFSRAFRTRFEVQPGRLREMAAPGTAAADLLAVNRPKDVLAWLKDL
ncbi:MAG: helix-turn-helix domain-containing protein [Pseudomonadota bacterium]|nr:helix-turn-helix domain-containing protein [Pseudomonadota bacterium]